VPAPLPLRAVSVSSIIWVGDARVDVVHILALVPEPHQPHDVRPDHTGPGQGGQLPANKPSMTRIRNRVAEPKPSTNIEPGAGSAPTQCRPRSTNRATCAWCEASPALTQRSTRPASSSRLPPLRLCSVAHRRDIPAAKHVGLFETIRQRRIAQRAGFDDALFVDERSRVLEGATWNIGFHDGTGLVWPAGDQLPGVTMELVKSLEVAKSSERELDLVAAGRFPIAFATNAAVGLRVIESIDDIRYDTTADALEDLSRRYLALPGEPV